MKKIITTLLVAVLALQLGGCVGNANLRKEGSIAVIKHGTVLALEEVTLEGTSSGVGVVTGAAVGTAVGANMGSSWKTMLIGSVIGQVVGAVAGHAAEKSITETSGIEVRIRMEDGTEIAVPQQRERVANISVGDRVRVVQSNGKTRIEK